MLLIHPKADSLLPDQLDEKLPDAGDSDLYQQLGGRAVLAQQAREALFGVTMPPIAMATDETVLLLGTQKELMG